MNIFILDSKPEIAAKYHCDKHVVKMVLETAQILCTAGKVGPYKPTHSNHPCVLWAGESIENWEWLYYLGHALGEEYTRRFYRVHKSHEVIKDLIIPPLPSKGLTRFALAMPEQYHHPCPVTAYRFYYIREKKHILNYTNRKSPSWIPKSVAN